MLQHIPNSHKMFYGYHLLLLSYFFCVYKCTTTFIQSEDRAEIPEQLIETWLKIPIHDIPYIHLMLRSSKYREDVENAYIQWFLKQTLIPFTLNTYDEIDDIKNPDTEEAISTRTSKDRNNYVIVSNSYELRSTAEYFVLPSGIYFFVITNDADLQELQDVCHALWLDLQVFKVFLLTQNGVLIYDPFDANTRGEYGNIIPYVGAQTIERTLFYNMRGYPLRVQLFKSVYSKPVLDPITKKVDYVYGVDGRVAEVLQDRMNFTMIYLDPDPDYFGYVKIIPIQFVEAIEKFPHEILNFSF